MNIITKHMTQVFLIYIYIYIYIFIYMCVCVCVCRKINNKVIQVEGEIY